MIQLVQSSKYIITIYKSENIEIKKCKYKNTSISNSKNKCSDCYYQIKNWKVKLCGI